MLKRRNFMAATAAVAVASQLSGRAFAQAKTTLRVVNTGDFRSFVPGAVPDVSTGSIQQHVYEGLLASKNDGTVGPMLADSYQMSADGLKCTFKLREGIKFHNGAPFTSAEVVWTWKMFMDPATKWAGRANFDGSQIIKVTDIKAIDPLTVEFSFEKPSKSFPLAIARIDYDSCGIAHPSSVGPDGKWVTAIGTGPYRFGEWKRGESVTIHKFADYKPRSEPADGLAGQKIAHFDDITFVLVKDESSATLAVQNGDIHLYYDMATSSADALSKVKDVKVVTRPVSGTRNMLFQTNDKVLKDKRIRQAINWSIDYENLAVSLYGEGSVPHTSFVPSTSSYFKEVEKKGFSYNPEKAKALLKAAGYKGELIVIQTNAQPQINMDNAIIIQSMMQAVGFNVQVQGMENAAKLSAYFEGAFQATIFHGTPLPNPIYWFEKLIGDKTVNKEKIWDTPEAIKTLSDIFATEDAAEQQRLVDKLHEMWLDDAPMLTWTTRVMSSGYPANLIGYEPWSGLKPRLWNVKFA